MKRRKGEAKGGPLHYASFIIIIIIITISCHRFSFFPGTSPLEPVVNPTTEAQVSACRTFLMMCDVHSMAVLLLLLLLLLFTYDL
jgi:hypothetical protein